MRLMKTPKKVEILVTNRCNLRCRYCSYFTSPAEVNGDLPTADWLAFFEELGRCAVMDVTLEGGEAFIREDLGELIDGIVRNRMRFDILTNGTLITEEMAAYIGATGRCNGIQVSIDGSAREVHDSCRGKGNFDRAVEGIRRLQRHGVPVTVRVTIHRYNADDIENTARLLLEEIGLDGFSTNSASFLGLCRDNADDIQLTVDQRSRVMETLLGLDRAYPGRIFAQAGPLAEARTWCDMERARRERRAPMRGRGFLKGCGGVFSKLGVRADGVMVPCIQMGHLALGRINRDSLAEIWWDHYELRRLRERADIPLQSFEECRDCPYIPYCTGNCPALSYTLTGDENRPSPDACLRRFLNEGGYLPDES